MILHQLFEMPYPYDGTWPADDAMEVVHNPRNPALVLQPSTRDWRDQPQRGGVRLLLAKRGQTIGLAPCR